MTDVLSELYVRMFPYVAAARLRRARTLPEDPFASRPESSPGAPLNRIGRQRRLSDPSYRAGVGVSTDTLYTSAWLDLAGGPLVLETPEFDGRYYSFQMAGADTSSDVAVGLRTHGNALPPVFLHGPLHDGPVPDDMIVVRSPTRYLNLPGRMVVDPDDAADLATAHALQDRMRLRTWEQYRDGVDDLPPVPDQVSLAAEADGVSFLTEVAAVVREEGLAAQDRDWLSSVVHPGLRIGPRDIGLEPGQEASVEAAFMEGRAEIDARAVRLGTQVGGWTVNLQGPRFGTDHLLRAAVARDQIYVTVPEEGVYPVGRVDSDGQALDGGRDYRVVFASDALPPVDAFWSVTAYNADGFLVENDAHIHAVSSRTAVAHPDGAVEIVIGQRPRRTDVSWLPTPPGEFYLMLRLFLPHEQVRNGGWLPPPIERIG